MLMNVENLNLKQSESLSGFFFDIAKGLMLGTIGFASVTPNVSAKIIFVFSSILLTIICVNFALTLLKKYD